MKVLFLDFDGVVIINGVISKAAIGNLNKLLSQEPDLKIVVSSSWRHSGLSFVKGMLGNYGVDPKKVIDVTDLTQKDDRGHHIERYVLDHKDIKHFVILDDKNDMDKILDHLVQINPYIGITGSDSKKALDILKKPC
jgi:hypothetical protein